MSEPSALPSFVPILILGFVAVGFAAITALFSYLIGRPRSNTAKDATYECGMPPIGTARGRFPVKFYLVCVVFILLDVDAAFLYPWALIYRELGLSGLIEMTVFVGILGGGFAYAWKSGVFDW